MTKEQIYLNPIKNKTSEVFNNLNGIKYQFLLENSAKSPSFRKKKLSTLTNKTCEKKKSDDGYYSSHLKIFPNLNELKSSTSDKRNLSNSSEPKSMSPTRLPSIKFDNIEPLKASDFKSDTLLKFKSDLYLSLKTPSQSNLRKSNRSSTDLGSEIDYTTTADDDDVFITTSDIIKIEKKTKQLSPVRTRRTVLSESELKALNISEKFMKEARNMIYVPERNSFCPRNTFYYLSLSNNKK